MAAPLTPEQFAPARALLEGARRRTRPRVHDLINVFEAVMYLLETGIPWRSLPPHFPPWRTVHEYFTQWTMGRDGDRTLLERAMELAGQQELIPRLRTRLGAAPAGEGAYG
ncbi:transposase [Pseudoduganella sp. GCM10020061]|uniref:transposase n=1 Tax=Pseudoduganella sp. GCM10020061 TaxID=3317345 RepID=UPI003629DAC8